MLVVCCLVVASCGEGAGDGADVVDVAGVWRAEATVPGDDDAEITHFELRQTGDSLAGNLCSCEGESCEAELSCDGAGIEGGVEGSEISLEYEFTDPGEDTAYTIEMTLQLLGDGSLSGAGSSTKCGCEFDVVATRLDR
ncbi:MAG: hypothetical protein HYY06_10830 [Deltaproteobacteria bacterium]|nr:hypothetical protein [Deltaproteobacteria bacterium]